MTIKKREANQTNDLAMLVYMKNLNECVKVNIELLKICWCTDGRYRTYGDVRTLIKLHPLLLVTISTIKANT